MTEVDAATLDRLERLISRMERLQGAGVVEPLAALDVHGNPSAVASGELIESAWGNSVANRVVGRYTASLPSPTDLGRVLINTDPTLATNGSPPLVEMAFNNAWNAVWPRSAGETVQVATIGNNITNVESQIGTLTVASSPYQRRAAVSVMALGVGGNMSQLEIRLKLNGTVLAKAYAYINGVGSTATIPPLVQALTKNTVHTFTVTALCAVGTSGAVLIDASTSRIDVVTSY